MNKYNLKPIRKRQIKQKWIKLRASYLKGLMKLVKP